MTHDFSGNSLRCARCRRSYAELAVAHPPACDRRGALRALWRRLWWGRLYIYQTGVRHAHAYHAPRWWAPGAAVCEWLAERRWARATALDEAFYAGRREGIKAENTRWRGILDAEIARLEGRMQAGQIRSFDRDSVALRVDGDGNEIIVETIAPAVPLDHIFIDQILTRPPE